MLSTTQLRAAWSPPCSTSRTTIALNGGAVVTVDPRTLGAVQAMNKVMTTYGYECTPPDCGAYVCRQITGGTGYSLHAYGIAIDINWTANPYFSYPALRAGHCDMPIGMPEAICAIRTGNGRQVWGWGGFYSSIRDYMHYEIVCTPADLATGIVGGTLTKLQKALLFVSAYRSTARYPFIGANSTKRDPRYVRLAQRWLDLPGTGIYDDKMQVKITAVQELVGEHPKHYGNLNHRTWTWLLYHQQAKGRG